MTYHERRVKLAREWGDTINATTWEWFGPLGQLRIAIAVEMGWENVPRQPEPVRDKPHPYYQISELIDKDKVTEFEAGKLVNDRRALKTKLMEWLLRIS